MCFDKELLKPFNSCLYTDLEHSQKSLFRLGDYTIKGFYDKSNRVRLVIYDSSQNKPVSGLLLGHLSQRTGYVIKGVYTVPKERRKGFAKLLLNIARQYLGNVRHSEDLTNDGLLWRNSVEGV